jgi:hypothetical protein
MDAGLLQSIVVALENVLTTRYLSGELLTVPSGYPTGRPAY